MLNKTLNVQVSDTTDGDSSNVTRYLIINFIFKELIEPNKISPTYPDNYRDFASGGGQGTLFFNQPLQQCDLIHGSYQIMSFIPGTVINIIIQMIR